jgi:Mrp family chromosome partitioning ATPase
VASKLVDGIVVVVRSNHAVQGALAETIRQLKLVDARILGFAFNGSTDAGGGYYKGKGYYKK